MKAIILAAGRGSRFKKLTNKIPKCFLKIDYERIIDKLLKSLNQENISKIGIVTGYKNYLFKEFKEKIFYNKRWKDTNMVYSFMKTKNWFLKEEILIIYSDIVFNKNLIKLIANEKYEFVILSNKKWKNLWKNRFKVPEIDAEKLKFNNKNFITEIGTKLSKLNESDGQFMGIIKIKPSAGIKIRDLYMKLTQKQKDNIDFTTFLNLYITKKIGKIKVIHTNKEWFEFDSAKDLKLYKSSEKYHLL